MYTSAAGQTGADAPTPAPAAKRLALAAIPNRAEDRFSERAETAREQRVENQPWAG